MEKRWWMVSSKIEGKIFRSNCARYFVFVGKCVKHLYLRRFYVTRLCSQRLYVYIMIKSSLYSSTYPDRVQGWTVETSVTEAYREQFRSNNYSRWNIRNNDVLVSRAVASVQMKAFTAVSSMSFVSPHKLRDTRVPLVRQDQDNKRSRGWREEYGANWYAKYKISLVFH